MVSDSTSVVVVDHVRLLFPTALEQSLNLPILILIENFYYLRTVHLVYYGSSNIICNSTS